MFKVSKKIVLSVLVLIGMLSLLFTFSFWASIKEDQLTISESILIGDFNLPSETFIYPQGTIILNLNENQTIAQGSYFIY